MQMHTIVLVHVYLFPRGSMNTHCTANATAVEISTFEEQNFTSFTIWLYFRMLDYEF